MASSAESFSHLWKESPGSVHSISLGQVFPGEKTWMQKECPCPKLRRKALHSMVPSCAKGASIRQTKSSDEALLFVNKI